MYNDNVYSLLNVHVCTYLYIHASGRRALIDDIDSSMHMYAYMSTYVSMFISKYVSGYNAVVEDTHPMHALLSGLLPECI